MIWKYLFLKNYHVSSCTVSILIVKVVSASHDQCVLFSQGTSSEALLTVLGEMKQCGGSWQQPFMLCITSK